MKSINQSKNDLRIKDPSLLGFSTFMINKGLMQNRDTIEFANIMNRMPKLPKEIVYLFYLHAIPKNYGYSKWAKISHNKQLKSFMENTGLPQTKAIECLDVLTKKQIKSIMKPCGGKIRRNK